MNPVVVLRILGLLLMLFSVSHLVPLLVSLGYGDGAWRDFLSTFVITFLTGLLLWLPCRHNRRELRTRDSFLLVTLFWTVLGVFGAIPFMLEKSLLLAPVDAIFESVSGLTTTGGSVISGLDALPPSILYYRQQLQLLGGLGIVAIAVAVLPLLGIGGMQLYKAESPGPVKENNLMPRVTETAKALLYVYLGLTLACLLSFWAAGMSLFDAIGHSFATIALGGMSTHDASMGYFDSPLINAIGSLFMLIAGINFGLHFIAWRHRSWRHYLQDPELRFYLAVIGVVCLVTVAVLTLSATYGLWEAVDKGVFQVLSFLTTNGHTVTDSTVWPSFLPFLLVYTGIIGACAGSTCGGIKMVRLLLIFKQGLREIERLIHPSAVIPVKLGNRRVPDRVVEAVWGFFSVYVFAYMAMLLVLLATGLDITTAFTAVGASINNLGVGLGGVANDFAGLPDTAKWVLSFGMLLGRLEVFTLLVLFTPQFWRR